MKAAVLARSGYFQLFIPAWHTCIFHVRNKAVRYVSGVLGGNDSLYLFVYCGSGRKEWRDENKGRSRVLPAKNLYICEITAMWRHF